MHGMAYSSIFRTATLSRKIAARTTERAFASFIQTTTLYQRITAQATYGPPVASLLRIQTTTSYLTIHAQIMMVAVASTSGIQTTISYRTTNARIMLGVSLHFIQMTMSYTSTISQKIMLKMLSLSHQQTFGTPQRK